MEHITVEKLFEFADIKGYIYKEKCSRTSLNDEQILEILQISSNGNSIEEHFNKRIDYIKNHSFFLKRNTENDYKNEANMLLCILKENDIKKKNAIIELVFAYNAFNPGWYWKVTDKEDKDKEILIKSNLKFVEGGGCISMLVILEYANGNNLLNTIRNKLSKHIGINISQIYDSNIYDSYILLCCKNIMEVIEKAHKKNDYNWDYLMQLPIGNSCNEIEEKTNKELLKFLRKIEPSIFKKNSPNYIRYDIDFDLGSICDYMASIGIEMP